MTKILTCGAVVQVINKEVHVNDASTGGIYVRNPIKVSDRDYSHCVSDMCVIITNPNDCDNLITIIQELKTQLMSE